jgi:tetratricopeptide (TPR) repeat protein
VNADKFDRTSHSNICIIVLRRRGHAIMGPKFVKRLAILLAAVFITGLVLYFAQRSQVERMGKSVFDEAQKAEKSGDYDGAVRKYRERLAVVPNDEETKKKLADSLLRGSKDATKQEVALQLYNEILTRDPGNNEIRRRQAELAVERSHFDEAYRSLEILIGNLRKQGKVDGGLNFLLGRCQEEGEDFDEAQKSYRAAIDNGAAQKVEATQRRANLLRGQLNNPAEADEIIDRMVRDDSQNYQVYLARGRYRRRFNLAGADADFRKALESTPDEPQVYLELAELAAAGSRFEDARRALQSGLEKAPKDPSLHQALATLELRAGSTDKAIASLYRSLDKLPDQVALRWTLANLQAEQGNTTDLMFQIQELRRLGFNPTLVEFLEAHYEVNSSHWATAIQSLNRLQPILESLPELKARINTLLARCYEQQGDPERLRDALERAVRAKPDYLPARLSLIAKQVDQGQIDQGIDEYRKLVQAVPAIRPRLIELLILRNRQQPADRRDWKEAEGLLKQESDASPQSAGPLVLQAELESARGNSPAAQAVLETARRRFPDDLRPWLASAELLRQQGKLEPAGTLLDQAGRALGDSVDLRLERSRLLLTRGGANLVKELDQLARDTGEFSPKDRRRLLKALGPDVSRLDGGLPVAARIWSEVAALDPNSIEPQLYRLEVALQAATDAELARKKQPDQARDRAAEEARAEVERIIAQIKRIDGADGLNARYQEIRYLIWQSQYAEAARAKTLRNAARSLIDELTSRRPDWSLIPLALASLVAQEIKDKVKEASDASKPKDDEAKKPLQKEIKALQEEAANLYIRAIELGQTNLAIVRQATDLLYATGRSAEVSQLWSRLPAGSIVGGGLQDQAAFDALRNRDFERALELTRKALDDRPNDFQERCFLAQILKIAGRQDEAVAEVRKGVDMAPGEPDRWLNLILLMVQCGQLEKAEKVIPEAEAALPKDKIPLALARYCGVLGLGYQEAKQADLKTKWCDTANSWFKKARDAKPDDPAVSRIYTEFLIRSGQLAEVEAQLSAIVGRTPTDTNLDEISWARRKLAAILLSRNDKQAARRAMALFEPMERDAAARGPGQKPAHQPEDLQILARAHVAQGTPEHVERAIAVLEELLPTGLADQDDRYLLARLYGGRGEWPKAREQYRAIVVQPELKRDAAALNRHTNYLGQYADELLKRAQTDADQEELIEAQDLIDKLKLLRPESADVLALQARLYKAKNEVSKAIELIETAGNRPNLPADTVQKLAAVAEEIGQVDLAERLLKQLAARPDRAEDRLPLIRFLARTGRTGAALDLFEPLWKSAKNPEALVPALLDVLLGEKIKAEPAQIDRAAGWLQKTLEQRPNSSIAMLGLGNLRERQGKFPEAEALYRRDIEQGGGDKMVSLNNLAWLIALRDGKLSRTALDLINRAIDRRGPLPELLDTRGVVYLKGGDARRAIEDLKQSVAGAPTAAKYFHLAEAYLADNRKDEGRQSLEKARAAGLTTESLHALEIPSYRQVLEVLGAR